MDLLLKLLQNQNTEESIRIICENIRANRHLITGTFWILLGIIIVFEIVTVWSMYRFEKRLKILEKNLKKDLQ